MASQAKRPPIPTRDQVELRPWYEIRAQDEESEVAELHIYGPIGGGIFWDPDAVSSKKVAEELDGLPDWVNTIRVFVSSEGGNVWDGQHIYSLLRRQRTEYGRTVEADIEALAASAATLITSAASVRRMARNASFMVHNPRGAVIGDHRAMRKTADIIEKIRAGMVAIYVAATGKSEAELIELLDDETWMTADEALEHGFVTEVTEPAAAAVAAAFELDSLPYDIPEQYRNRIAACAKGPRGARTDPAETHTDDDSPAAAGGDPEDTPMGDKNKKTETQVTDGGDGNEPQPNAEDTKAAEARATEAERERMKAIRAHARHAITAGMERDRADEIVDEALDEGLTAEAAGGKFLQELAARSDDLGPGANAGHLSIVPGEDEHDKRVTGLVAALCARSGTTQTVLRAQKSNPDHEVFQDFDPDPGEFRGKNLYDMCRDDLERQRPGCTKGLSRMRVVGMFFAAAGGRQTTSDFAVALENALHKVLLGSYRVSPDTWRRFCAVGEVSDFRPHQRHRTGFLARLAKILEDGEFERQDIPDTEKELQQAETFGNIVSLTRKAIINDDMSVFSRVASSLGRAAALTIEVEVYALLALNGGLGPNMQDGNPLFDASHNNIGSGSALDFAGIEADRVVMAEQTDPSGNEILDLRPSVLVVPIGLEGTAMQINETQFEDHNNGKPNRVLGLFEDIVGTARLTGTRRYLFADPGIAPTIEVAFLEGEQDPFMEMKDGWDRDGVDWKVRHDIATGAVDFRGAVTNAGQ